MNNTSAAAESFTLNRIKVFWLIRRIGVIRIGYSDFIIPAVTLMLSFLILGESLTWAKVGGMVLVLLGVVLVEM
nr:EamA family transporter [Ktedonobacteraceae bacterium]